MELYEDFLRGVRVIVNSAIASGNEADSTQSNIQRFMAAGGNAAIGVAVPLLASHKNDIVCVQGTEAPVERSQHAFEAIFWPRLGLDVPAVGSALDDVTMNTDIGGDLQLVIVGAEGEVSVFAQVRGGGVIGTDDFYRSLGLRELHAFRYTLVTAGIFLGRGVTFSAAIPWGGAGRGYNRMKGVIGLSLRKYNGHPPYVSRRSWRDVRCSRPASASP